MKPLGEFGTATLAMPNFWRQNGVFASVLMRDL